MAGFDLRYLGIPGIQNMLTAQPNLVPDNMLTSIPAQSPGIDPTATAAIPQPQAPIQVPQGDLNYFPPMPDENRAPVTSRPFEMPSQSAGVDPTATGSNSRQQGPSGFDKFLGFLQGLGTGDNAIAGIANAFTGAKYGTPQNQTVNYLMKNGFDEESARGIVANPVALQQTLMTLRKTAEPTRGVVVGKRLVNPVTGQLIADYSDGASDTEYGLNPQYGVDENNNPVLIQIGKDGKAIQTALPAGVSLSKEPIKLDAGTNFVLLDPITRQQIGVVPKDVAGEAAANKAGAIRGEQLATQPQAQSALNTTVSSLDRLEAAASEIENDPALGRITGWMGVLPNAPGGSAASAQARLNTLKSQIGFTVLQAMREASKTGGALGAISDKENELLQNNLASLDQAQNEEDLRRELGKIREYVRGARQRLRDAYSQTYGGEAGTVQPTAPSGAVDYTDYFKN
ncbi:hypothetical protein CN878_16695 [Ochrobactrum sp. 695/2009]|nr:hypothetical protein CN881_19590 [Ochrobactrum sp. 721/2009]PJT16741.1 hypothetical protein CN880_10455 [Ochrobactrum sp. 720/2009]PJT26563.1 hypothetical protein CN879_06420 [Ochrobactrum sp. 715/2009]PJT28621.1 hypothetical protein CN878_16695 [Ochrobactrum sp. 695/2009]PJT36083.1 hypothetical protein CN877_08865 [Ochrobactrum sp. 689/2009]